VLPNVRLLHTSDVHVGEYGWDEEKEPACLAALRSTVELASREQVDLVIVVGDLFDHNRVKQPIIDAAAAILSGFAGPVVVLPGNHDPLADDSVYRRMPDLDHVTVLDDSAGATALLPELRMRLWGKAHVSYADDLRPLLGAPPPEPGLWNLALAHGHYVRGAYDEMRSYLIRAEEIAACGYDYVALGHWDITTDISAGGVVAWYSGSPNRAGRSVLVELEDREGRPRAEVRPVELPRRTRR
jgi:DNA repair protein SbcD/Mre11